MNLNPNPTEAPPRHPVRILYAEDRPEIRDVMCMLVERQGNHVEVAADGVDAAARLAQNPEAFDLLLTDHQMPRLDGLGLVRRARELLFRGKIAVLSSELTELIRERYVALGVDLLLPKPILPRAFDAAIQQLFPGAGLYRPMSAA